MADPVYERLFIPNPPDSFRERQEIALLYCDDTHPFREHFVCYRAAGGPSQAPRFVVAAMSAKDSDFFDYRGPAPSQRGLSAGAIYLFRNSPQAKGDDTEHVIIALADKTIEFTGMAFNLSPPIEAASAAAALWRHMGQWLGDSLSAYSR